MSSIAIEKNESDLSDKMWNPPGGFLIWLIVLFELFFFGIAYTTIAHFRHINPEAFRLGKAHLDLKFGIFLTLSLLFSGWQLAEFVHHYFSNKHKIARINFYLAFLSGLIFIFSKSFDYYYKIQQGFVLGSSDFWDLYWLLTSFHFVHVLVGLSILIFIHYKITRNQISDFDAAIRGSANFWHMCDVIWLFIFPLFYIGN